MSIFKIGLSEANQVLKWATHPGYEEAILGDFENDDGVRFSLQYLPTCNLRGPWKLLIEVEDWNKTWGSFDDHDMPLRYYHSKECALSEADAIARALSLHHAIKSEKR